MTTGDRSEFMPFIIHLICLLFSFLPLVDSFVIGKSCCIRIGQLHGSITQQGEARNIETIPGLVEASWLYKHLDDPDIAILDIRGEVKKALVNPDGLQAFEYIASYSDYVDGHIPGAAFVDWTKDIAHTGENNVPVQLVPLDELRSTLESKGVGLMKHVVIYDNGNMLFATRLWWALKLAGHQSVSILDGGWARWIAEEDYPVSVDAPCPLKIYQAWQSEEGATSSFSSIAFKSHCVDVNWVIKQIDSSSPSKEEGGSIQIIDARSQEQYSGRVSRSQRAGHIPSALSVPYKDFLTPEIVHPKTGLKYRKFKSVQEIQTTFERAGVRIEDSCCYCNGGVASTVVIFVLNQLYGVSTYNYDGSWNEWGSQFDLPVEA